MLAVSLVRSRLLRILLRSSRISSVWWEVIGTSSFPSAMQAAWCWGLQQGSWVSNSYFFLLILFWSLQLFPSFEQSLLWWDRWTSPFLRDRDEVERVAPGGRKETEKQDGNLRFPDLNVTAYYCHCHSASISWAAVLGSAGALMFERGLSQAVKQAMIPGKGAPHASLLQPKVCLQGGMHSTAGASRKLGPFACWQGCCN